MRKPLMSAAAAIALIAGAPAAFADMAAAEKWIDEEFQPSALSRDEQVAEMQWFIDAAAPFAGMEINVLSETIPTHTYESTVLTKAFEEITGIKVNHQLLGEGEVVQAVQTQMQTNRNLYDGYVNDSDLIGTHSRLQQTYNLTEQMAGPWADVTSPTLDLEDFIGISFTTGPDGNLYQLPDQQFANLYWFRKDWFDNPEYQAAFKEKYGYDLGVPVNWSAYEDIAEFFTNDVKEIDGVQVFGHMDYGKRAPDLGWRMTDAWLAMAGVGTAGEPNGIPIDEWGIRMEEGSCNPLGSKTSRGGEANGPAAVYAIAKWDEWLREYAPPGAASYDFYQSLPALSQGNVAQQIFWYTAFLADMVKPQSEGNNTVDAEGNPLWRAAPLAARPLLAGRPEGRLPGRRLLDDPALDAGRPRQGRLALRAVRHLEDRRHQEEPRRADLRPRHDDPRRELHRARAEARRRRRVLPLARPGALVADRHQRARLPEARADLVAADRQRELRLGDAAGGDGRARRRDGRHHGPHAAGRRGVQRLRRLRPAAEPRGRPVRVARQARRPEGQAREREAAGRDHQLRRDGQGLGRGRPGN